MAHSILPHVVVPAPPDIIVGFGSGGSSGSKARRWAIAPDWARSPGGAAAKHAVGGAWWSSMFGIRMGPPGTLSRTVYGTGAWWHSLFGTGGSASSGDSD